MTERLTSAASAPAVDLPQSRYLATAIPGPRSLALHRERQAQVSGGFGVVLPVFVEQADGGILQDVDGNRLIDFASGIAVTSIGASHPARPRAGFRPAGEVHPHLLHGHRVPVLHPGGPVAQ